MLISADEEILRIVTRAPLLYPHAGVVLAVYRFDSDSATLYYQEKRDFYNVDYEEDYVPDYDEMVVLIEESVPISFSYPDDSSSVVIVYEDMEYEITPWCQVSTREDAI